MNAFDGIDIGDGADDVDLPPAMVVVRGDPPLELPIQPGALHA